MSNIIIVKKKINDYRKKIIVSGDKSISIRWVLFASLAKGVSMAKNILKSEDVLATIDAVRKLGIKVILKKNFCKIYGNGLEGYVYKKNITINAQNSGTLSRLLPGFLVNCTHPIKIIGDKSLSRRDFKRILVPLNKFGANILGPSIKAHLISSIVPKKTDLNKTPNKLCGYFNAYFIAKVAPHEPPTIKNFFNL